MKTTGKLTALRLIIDSESEERTIKIQGECEEYTPSTRDTYPFLNPYPHVNTVTMSELITTSSAYIINGDSPMTSVANTVAMTTLAVHTLQPLIFYTRDLATTAALCTCCTQLIRFKHVPKLISLKWVLSKLVPTVGPTVGTVRYRRYRRHDL